MMTALWKCGKLPLGFPEIFAAVRTVVMWRENPQVWISLWKKAGGVEETALCGKP